MSVLKVKDLKVQFGGLTAINNLSFETREREILSVIGPNGAGKTTLFNAITGFVRPVGGRVLVDDTDITGWPPHRVTKLGVARTFQKRSFFPSLTVWENVVLGQHLGIDTSLLEMVLGSRAQEKQARARRVALELLDFVGLISRRDVAAGSLPYGEQRLLGLAIALAARPSILLLDEPCAGSNPAESEVMVRLIGEIRQLGMSLVLVEHQMRVVMGVSDRIIVLSYGEKLAEGVPAEIQRNPGVIAAYLGRRAGSEACA
ncbi:MAG TPA: ABC transporter ATP-binding protein [Firmicutes bacterium]|nr:ABC transporter ATP-binding protein [Bacillota bacterium]